LSWGQVFVKNWEFGLKFLFFMGNFRLLFYINFLKKKKKEALVPDPSRNHDQLTTGHLTLLPGLRGVAWWNKPTSLLSMYQTFKMTK
jgi:hypothetical protein